MKKVLIFNPYWDTLGGGERYVATVIQAYLKADYKPVILWKDKTLIQKIQRRFGLDLKEVEIDPGLLKKFISGNTLIKLKLSRGFDSIFWVSDGSVPLLASRNNILHFQVPFNSSASFLNRLKIRTFRHIICNSIFTKKVIDQNYGCDSKVVYPPVASMSQAKKENVILSVGRFDNILHSKRQDVLIDAFKELQLSGWKLVLAGGSLDSAVKVQALKKFIGDYPIEVVINPSFERLQKLYSVAKIYWHAAGFGSNLKKNPEKAEHFGIVTVEAMSAGAIPIVFGGGGQLEIISDGNNGFLWQNKEELITKTKQTAKNYNSFKNIISNAIKTAELFSQEKFIHEFQQYLS